MNQQPFQCRKCGHDKATVQFRRLTVQVAWELNTFELVGPCLMCLRCGEPITTFQITIGEFVPLELHPPQANGEPSGVRGVPAVQPSDTIPAPVAYDGGHGPEDGGPVPG